MKAKPYDICAEPLLEQLQLSRPQWPVSRIERLCLHMDPAHLSQQLVPQQLKINSSNRELSAATRLFCGNLEKPSIRLDPPIKPHPMTALTLSRPDEDLLSSLVIIHLRISIYFRFTSENPFSDCQHPRDLSPPRTFSPFTSRPLDGSSWLAEYPKYWCRSRYDTMKGCPPAVR